MILQDVLLYLDAGFNAIPIQPNTKRPLLGFNWAEWMKKKPSPEMAKDWFHAPGTNIGLIQGAISGNTIVLDIETDAMHQKLLNRLSGSTDPLTVSLLKKLRETFRVTPPRKGAHYYLGSRVSVPGCKLATCYAVDDDTGATGINTLIEVRGEGNYVLAPPSTIDGYGAYQVAHGSPHSISILTDEEREALFAHCRALSIIPFAPTKVCSEDGRELPDLERIRDEHSYVDNILDDLEGVCEESTGWSACCPSKTHGVDGVDNKPSFRVTIGENGFVILKCRAGCPIDDIYDSLGLRASDMFPPYGETPAPCLLDPQGEIATPEVESENAAIYQEILDGLPVSPRLISNMKARGVSEEDCKRLGYRYYHPVVNAKLLAPLADKYGERLLLVPGITRNHHGYSLNVYGESILFPVRNTAGIISSLKARLFVPFSNGSRFIALANYRLPRPSTRTHYPLAVPESLDIIRVTEGEMKADIATLLSGIYTIGTNGISCLDEPLDYLAECHPKARILLAPDAADFSKQSFISQVMGHLEWYNEADLDVALEIWDTGPGNTIKGIDDALQANTSFEVLEYEDAMNFLEHLHSHPGTNIHQFFNIGV